MRESTRRDRLFQFQFRKPHIHVARAALNRLQPPFDAFEFPIQAVKPPVHYRAQADVERQVRANAQEHRGERHAIADRHSYGPSYTVSRLGFLSGRSAGGSFDLRFPIIGGFIQARDRVALQHHEKTHARHAFSLPQDGVNETVAEFVPGRGELGWLIRILR